MSFIKLSISLFFLSTIITRVDAQSTDNCFTSILPAVHLKNRSVFLSVAGKTSLDSIIKMVKKLPQCKIKVTSHGASSEEEQQMSWDKVVSVINYLVLKGIDKERLIFNYGEEGDPTIVDLVGTKEDGPSWVSAPHPCFSYHKLTPHRCKHLHH